MKKALFLYSTKDGQTVKIFKHIEAEMNEFECELVDLHLLNNVDFTHYDKVVIGASIRYGHLNKKFYQFINTNLDALKAANVAFFLVNLTARKEDQGKDTPEGSVYMQTFLKKSAWKPDLLAVFAGALRYPQYRFFDRFMIQLIMRMTGGETDTTKEVEYTNWKKVSIFAESIKKM
ncbi:protoporphyrinogen oxidase [Vibrio sp. MACH09]|uniref:menaquinone-dependent protoporphyrinogen IX dehydrogenase n=1 Tax=unclassified Vibrio TaxID=2614977 RepID=UPI0014938D37|nr:menaquinone-dependent protoporphyrinogen IX dehydrogenase [Vibrio sp. MACH09]NOI67950.1 menaquinone-dependent protoporphyrinogen IX dehydrogenase [Vibrio sp. 99-8-1]GLO59518.1 protoporphyrinogen oxidase [Vibrio sp. MACH09]